MTERAKKYEAEALKAVKERKLMFFDHIFAYVSFSSSTAYNHGLEKLESIKEAILENKINGVNYMLQKWIASDNATLNIAAMRIISNDAIRRSLNQQYIETTVKSDPFTDLLKKAKQGDKPIEQKEQKKLND